MIDFNDGDIVTSINGMEPFQYLSDFVDKYGILGRSVHAMVNYLFTGSFSIRFNAQVNILDEPDTFTLVLNDEAEINVSYTYLALDDLNENNMHHIYEESLETNPFNMPQYRNAPEIAEMMKEMQLNMTHKLPMQRMKEYAAKPKTQQLLLERFNYTAPKDTFEISEESELEILYQIGDFAQLYRYNENDLILRVPTFMFLGEHLGPNGLLRELH